MPPRGKKRGQRSPGSTPTKASKKLKTRRRRPADASDDEGKEGAAGAGPAAAAPAAAAPPHKPQPQGEPQRTGHGNRAAQKARKAQRKAEKSKAEGKAEGTVRSETTVTATPPPAQPAGSYGRPLTPGEEEAVRVAHPGLTGCALLVKMAEARGPPPSTTPPAPAATSPPASPTSTPAAADAPRSPEEEVADLSAELAGVEGFLASHPAAVESPAAPGSGPPSPAASGPASRAGPSAQHRDAELRGFRAAMFEKRPKVAPKPTSHVTIDIEATNKDVARAEVAQLAIVIYDPDSGAELHRWKSLVKVRGAALLLCCVRLAASQLIAPAPPASTPYAVPRPHGPGRI